MKQLFPFLVIMICIGVYYLYISPGLERVDELRLEYAQYQNVLNQSNELKKARDNMLSTYSNISEEDTNRLDKIIPEKFENIMVLSDINSIASKNGMTSKDFKVVGENGANPDGNITSVKKVSPYKTATVSFSVSGSYEQFIGFLSDMETSLRIMDVKSMSLRENKKQNGQVSLEYTLDVNTYYLR